MGNIHRSFLILFSLIVIHVLMSSLLCLHHERKVQLLDRNQGRRLIVPFASLSANVNKSTGANKDPRKPRRQVSGRLHQVFQTLLRTSSHNSLCIEIFKRKRISFSFCIFAVFHFLVLLLDRNHNWISIQFLVFLSGFPFL
ncbi:hypothetical protein NC651_009737 [Populus alba x Populus x berolinensis]|nr:hypothetical protein NC651_009737 [Populus alba x Populus x berolinensis]